MNGRTLATAFLVLSPITFATPARGQTATEGYPVEQFLRVTTYTQVAVAPDGRAVAFIAASDDFKKDVPEMAIWRLELDGSGRVTGRRRLTYTPGSYSSLHWSPDGRYVGFLSVQGDVKTPQLYLLDMQGGEPRRLSDPETDSKGVSAFDWSPDGGIVLATPVPPTKEQREATEKFYGDAKVFPGPTPNTAFWRLSDPGGDSPKRRRVATVGTVVQEMTIAPDGRTLAYLSGPPADPEIFSNSFAQTEVYRVDLADGTSRQLTHNFVSEGQLRWSADGKTLFAAGGGEVDAKRSVWTQGRLFRIDATTGDIRVLAPDFIGELSAPFGGDSYALLPDGTILASGNVSTRTNVYAVPAAGGEARRLTDYHGAVSALSASSDGRIVAFVVSTDSAYPEVYVARGRAELDRATPATDLNAALTAMPKPGVETVRWANGEGDTIEGVLYWPPGRRGASELPLVVDIHGGPWWARTEELTFNAPFTFAYYPALLASRGYLVLEPNYRGGTGRGSEFLHAIEGYSCSRPSTDILTGVDFLVKRGWADASRMGVMGYSYGGVLTNCIIVRTDRFAAASSGAGIYDDISYFGTADNFVQNIVRNDGKPPWENLDNYWKESAISGAGNIKTPTLVLNGGADRRVPTTQGYELYRALVWLGVPARHLVFPGEGHGFREPSHKLTKVRAELDWMDHYLLGQPSRAVE